MMLIRKPFSTFLVWAYLFLASSLNIFAAEIIDVDQFSFPSSQVKGVRIVSFNTEAQKFSSIHYFVQTTATPLNLNFWGMNFDSEANVDVTPQFKLKDHILTTRGSLKIGGKDAIKGAIKHAAAKPTDRQILKELMDYQSDGTEVTRYVLSYEKLVVKPGDDIMESLNEHSGKTKSKGNFSATFHRSGIKETETLSNLTAVRVDNNEERGIIGELATTLTMIGFGYQGNFSKYGTDNGFDGAFTDKSTDPEMFLTESKCRERADGVQTIMRDNLSEERIGSKLRRISTHTHPSMSDEARELLVATGELIEKFISESSAKIFKFAHRIKPDGTCECLVEKFDLNKYQASLLPTLSPDSPPHDKLVVLKSITQQLCSSDDQKVDLYMRTIKGTSVEKLRLVFQSLNIDEDQQKAMLATFAPKKKVNRALNFDDADEEAA